MIPFLAVIAVIAAIAAVSVSSRTASTQPDVAKMGAWGDSVVTQAGRPEDMGCMNDASHRLRTSRGAQFSLLLPLVVV